VAAAVVHRPNRINSHGGNGLLQSIYYQREAVYTSKSNGIICPSRGATIKSRGPARISLEVDVTEEYQSRSVFYQKAEEPTNFYQKAKSRAV
jgi:hypothetical protein